MKRAEFVLPAETIRALQPFFPAFELTRVRLREGIPRYVIGEPLGFALGKTIYLRKGVFQPETTDGLALLAHELAHCQQYERLGTLRFLVRYAWAYFRNRWRGLNHDAAYRNIPFEIEARLVEDLAFETLQAQLEIAPQLQRISLV